MKNKKFTTEDFIKKAKEKHGNKYNYSLSKYNGSDLKLKIICPVHGVFEQVAYSHYRVGAGCIKCAEDYTGNLSKKKVEDFIIQANKTHNNKYDYSLSEYKNALKKIKINCPIHGLFEQTPDNHLHGKGCKKCYFDKLKELYTLTNEEFIEKANLVHENFFIYKLSAYKHNNIKVKIICPTHGEFEQTPSNHLSGKGCRKCSSSKGQSKIRKILKELNLKFTEEQIFEGCKNKLPLPFDFYLPEHNICIEFDGIQHYEPIEFFGGIKKFEERVKMDKIKNEYCKNYNIRLIRIKYNENINLKLSGFLSHKLEA